MIVAISGSVHPQIARRVTAVPRRSWNVTPTIPARLHAFAHDARKPSAVHGFPSLFVSMIGGVFRRCIERGFQRRADRDHDKGRPPLDCRSLIWLPS